MQPASPAKGLGLYIHFPFCAYKCGYCDFNSWVEKDTGPQRLWLEGIKRELGFWLEQSNSLDQHFIDTLFVGGGTPSLLDPQLWIELRDFLYAKLSFASDLEWTIEANPETVNRELLDSLAGIGVNRLSVGIQSFQEKFLKRLERGATRDGNFNALSSIKMSWPGRWSFDLMFGLPGQSLSEWQADLREGLKFSPDHLSAYQLTLTTEKSKKWLQGSDTELLEFFREARDISSAHGLESYEISNFARPGSECRHNLKYWRAESFLGVGPGAYSLLSPEISGSPWGAHLKSPARFEEWLKWTHQPELGRAELRDEKTHITELLLLGLRLDSGIEKARFPESVDWRKLSKLSHLIEFPSDRIRTTQRGREILDTTVLESVRELFPT